MPANSWNNHINGNGRSDQRYFPRWEVTNRVSYKLDHDEISHKGYTVDLSCAGACLSVDTYFEPNQKLNLTIYLAKGKMVNVGGRIPWAKKENSHVRLGIDFQETSPEAQDLILRHAFELNRNEIVNHWFKGWEGR